MPFPCSLQPSIFPGFLGTPTGSPVLLSTYPDPPPTPQPREPSSALPLLLLLQPLLGVGCGEPYRVTVPGQGLPIKGLAGGGRLPLPREAWGQVRGRAPPTSDAPPLTLPTPAVLTSALNPQPSLWVPALSSLRDPRVGEARGFCSLWPELSLVPGPLCPTARHPKLVPFWQRRWGPGGGLT